MSEDKQIEEMAKHCHFYEEGKCLLLEDKAVECDTKCDMFEFAKRLYNADYRRASEVAEEIFAEIEYAMGSNYSSDSDSDYPMPHYYEDLREDIAKLKKKYTEEGK